MTTATNAQDVIAVLNDTFAQVFTAARAMKAGVWREAKAMEHPIEDGSLVTDHRILLPVEVDLSLMLVSADYPDVHQEIRGLYDRGDLLIVQTRVDVFDRMLITRMPHEERSEVIDGVTLELRLRQVVVVTPQFAPLKVAQPKDANTTKRGQQQPTETDETTATKRKSSVLAGVFS